jgi:hypothetical protein
MILTGWLSVDWFLFLQRGDTNLEIKMNYFATFSAGILDSFSFIFLLAETERSLYT